MADSEEKRQRRDILNRRLDSYYEALMLEARRGSDERWQRLVECAPERRPAAASGSRSATTSGSLD
jgi:hypothetical protein